MPQISKEEVEKVARLARIELTEEEISRFQEQLSAVLGYVEHLQKVNTDGVEMTAQVTGLENVTRADAVMPFDEAGRQQALEQAPEVVANLVKVKSVF